ncbi:hypothetical protein U8V72_20860 [Priestia filamentosa]|uniref:hypothetical protein n=1 Tax=Priestia filamentosa TaxID=1402861 RepID=UPI00397B824A
MPYIKKIFETQVLGIAIRVSKSAGDGELYIKIGKRRTRPIFQLKKKYKENINDSRNTEQ